MSKFLGFLLGVVVALAGPAVFGVLAAPGGIELNAKEMALAFGIGALIFWIVVSYFSGAGALGAFVAFGTLVYCWLWIPNRTTNFLNDVPGVTTGMIEGSKQYTLNGVVPILTVISLVYAIQLMVHSAQRRRRERVEADRLQRDQEAAQAQQEADAAAVYPVAGSTYPAEGAGYAGSYGNSSRYDDLFDEDPEPVRPRNQADEQTSQFPVSAPEQTAQFPGAEARGNDAQGNDSGSYPGDDTVLVPTDRDETTQVPVAAATPPQPAAEDVAADEQTVAAPAEAEEQKPARPVAAAVPADEPKQVQQTEPQPREEPVAKADEQPRAETPAEVGERPGATTPGGAGEQPTAAAPVGTDEEPTDGADEEQTVVAPSGPGGQSAAAAPGKADDAPTVVAPGGKPAAAVGADNEATVVAPVEGQGSEQVGEKKGADGPQAAVVAPGTSAKGDVLKQPGVPMAQAQSVSMGQPAPGAREQMGQQYRERMEDPEDTGEIYLSAFENPTQVSIRPAGA